MSWKEGLGKGGGFARLETGIGTLTNVQSTNIDFDEVR